MSDQVDSLADQVAEFMADRKKLSVQVPCDDAAVLLAHAMQARGFKAEASTGLVGSKADGIFKTVPIVRVEKKRGAKGKVT